MKKTLQSIGYGAIFFLVLAITAWGGIKPALAREGDDNVSPPQQSGSLPPPGGQFREGSGQSDEGDVRGLGDRENEDNGDDLDQMLSDEEATDTLDRVSEHLGRIGRDHHEFQKDIDDIVDEERAAKDEIKQSVGELKGRGAFITFILGPDFKNIGDLRSTMVMIGNHIDKLEALKASTTPAIQSELQAETKALDAEKARLQAIVESADSKFSLFGWFFRFLQ